MALESIHACDCSNGLTYVGEISIGKVSGLGDRPTHEEIAVSNYYVVPTKMIVDRTWTKETGEEHHKHVSYGSVASAIYLKLKEEGALNRKQVKLPGVAANHELDF